MKLEYQVIELGEEINGIVISALLKEKEVNCYLQNNILQYKQ